MASLNSVNIIGRLGKDPEIKQLQDGKSVGNFPVATTHRYSDKQGKIHEETEWHHIVVWGKTAEACVKILKKGWLAYIQGRIRTRKWKDKEGIERYITEIVADIVQFLNPPKEKGDVAPQVVEPDFDVPF